MSHQFPKEGTPAYLPTVQFPLDQHKECFAQLCQSLEFFCGRLWKLELFVQLLDPYQISCPFNDQKNVNRF